MRRTIFAPLMVSLISLVVMAQTVAHGAKQVTNNPSYGYGYLFVAPGVASGGSATLHIGGGGEVIFNNGFGMGAEVGYLGPIEAMGQGFGVFSVNGSYYFLKANQSEKVAPFVTGGYTGIFRSGYASGINFGGGVNYWFKKRVGLRFEIRDNLVALDGAAHLLNARIGLTVR